MPSERSSDKRKCFASNIKFLRNPFVPSELKIEVENETAEGKSTDDDPQENYYFSAVGCCHILLYRHMELDRSRCFKRLRIKKLETKDQWMKYAESVLQPFFKIWNDISHKMPCPVLNHIIRRMIKQYFCDMKKGEELMEMKNHSTDH